MEELGKIGQVMGRGSLAGRTLAAGHPVHIADVEADAEYTFRDFTRVTGTRSMLGVPLLRNGKPVGLLSLYRTSLAPFTPRQVELVATFADQAIIAIENVRLFEEVQARERDLQESLEYQTAISDVLNVISRSPTNVAPVFDVIAKNGARLCAAQICHVFRFDGRLIHFAASQGSSAQARDAMQRGVPLPPQRGFAAARAILNNAVEEIPDVFADPDYTHHDMARVDGFRSVVAVPMCREGRPIGAIGVGRAQTGRFSMRQIELLKTFADQAVIAIENARLFEAEQARTREVMERTRELAQALEYQTAISDVLGVIGRSKFNLQPVLTAIVSTACRLCDAQGALIALRQGDNLEFTAGQGEARAPNVRLPIVPASVAGRAVLERKTIHGHDLSIAGDEFPLGHELASSSRGHRTALGVPLVREDQAIGCLLMYRAEVRPFSDKQIALLATFADQAVIAKENVRLFEEIARKSHELEIASQHKSQFVANMSHELRTPLAAILGYAELIQEGFYGELPEKSMDALTRIRSNGKHLLGLINTVLDIAKIESGQFSLNVGEYAIENVVETVRVATESLAETKRLSLKTDVAKPLPIGLGDEQRLTQVLLNLVGNAIKFTDTGEVRVVAKVANGHFALSVADTGPGIPEHEQPRIFEQFHQVDSSNTKAKGGTGLGLAIAKQIVEMHGGRIWVESTLGNGATFHMHLPTRTEIGKGIA